MDDDRVIETEERQEEDVEFDEADTVDEEDEYGEDEEDGEEDDDEDEDVEDYEDEEAIVAERTSPRVSSLTSQGAVVINDGFLEDSNECVGKRGKKENEGGNEGKKEVNTSEIDVCPICFQAWTSAGDHRICCLPCGHIYGMSCLNKWLLRCPSSGKCPQCKRLCTLKDVIVLYTTRLCVAEEELHKASSNHFPPTEEGFSAFQQFTFSWMDSLRQRIDALERRMDSLEQTFNDLRGWAQENTR